AAPATPHGPQHRSVQSPLDKRMMQQGKLDDLEWHDLPVSSLSLHNSGLRLEVTPYDDTSAEYSLAVLSLTDCTELKLSIEGTLGPDDMKYLEVSGLDFQHLSEGKISGTLGILPHRAGFWTICFAEASWSLTLSNSAMHTDGGCAAAGDRPNRSPGVTLGPPCGSPWLSFYCRQEHFGVWMPLCG
ncbi:MAG: hypothetical protein P1V81_05865, partial [Planctomycetota bacterium]|nr:hypothetical protein [Planctomycetota bacterium]